MMDNGHSTATPLRNRAGTTKDLIRLVVAKIVKDFRKAGITHRVFIRAEVLAAAQEAMDIEDEDDLDVEWFDDRDATSLSAMGLFLLAFEATREDHRDQFVQEALFGRIERALTDVLSGA